MWIIRRRQLLCVLYCVARLQQWEIMRRGCSCLLTSTSKISSFVLPLWSMSFTMGTMTCILINSGDETAGYLRSVFRLTKRILRMCKNDVFFHLSQRFPDFFFIFLTEASISRYSFFVSIFYAWPFDLYLFLSEILAFIGFFEYPKSSSYIYT